jgi:hypothetical protein
VQQEEDESGIDRKEDIYVKSQPEESWDVETIGMVFTTKCHLIMFVFLFSHWATHARDMMSMSVSTYTTTENHPHLISDGGRSKKIRVSARSGFPIVQPDADAEDVRDWDEDGGEEPVNLGVRRDRTETTEEKKARKETMKIIKRQRRGEKRNMKTKFKEEETRQAKIAAQNPSLAKYPL